MNKDIPDYKLCCRLKELGYSQDWEVGYTTDWRLYVLWTYCDQHEHMNIEVYAPTIWEMMDGLPEWFNIEKKNWEYYLHYSKYSFTVHLDTLANTLAKTLIILIEQWYLDPKLLD